MWWNSKLIRSSSNFFHFCLVDGPLVLRLFADGGEMSWSGALQSCHYTRSHRKSAAYKVSLEPSFAFTSPRACRHNSTVFGHRWCCTERFKACSNLIFFVLLNVDSNRLRKARRRSNAALLVSTGFNPPNRSEDS